MIQKESYISVFVRDMRVQVRIGLLDEEKLAPQALIVNVQAFMNPDYLQDALAGQYVNYAAFYSFIKDWEDRTHTAMLEELARDLVSFAFDFKTVEAVAISISKPNIFAQAQQAGVELFLNRTDLK
jgi:dihydroneopterin aldolase